MSVRRAECCLAGENAQRHLQATIAPTGAGIPLRAVDGAIATKDYAGPGSGQAVNLAPMHVKNQSREYVFDGESAVGLTLPEKSFGGLAQRPR
jgi:hypothetical protein